MLTGGGDHHALAGAMSGLVSALLVTPLDVVKIRLQNRPQHYHPLLQSQSAIATLQNIARHEGPRALFRGLSASVLAYIPDRMLWFYSYNLLKGSLSSNLLLPRDYTGIHLAATFVASSMCTIVVSPLWVVRTRLMVCSEIYHMF
jgi:hypothetical protein